MINLAKGFNSSRGYGFGKHKGYGFSTVINILASILYKTDATDFIYGTNANNEMVLKNQGSIGSLGDTIVSSGRGVALGANNLYFNDIGANYITYFSFTDNQFHVVQNSPLFNYIQINNILISAAQPSAADLLVLNANPNLMGKLALSTNGTTPELDIALVATDKWFPCLEETGANVINARPGASAVNSGVVGMIGEITGTGNSVVDQGNYDFLVTLAIPAVKTYRPRFMGQIAPGSYNVKVTITVHSGTQWLRIVNGVTLDVLLGLGTHTYTFAHTSTDAAAYHYPLMMNGTLGTTPSSSNVKLEYTAADVYPIGNYVETIRTASDNEFVGIQTTAFKMGGGVPTDYVDAYLVSNPKQAILLPKTVPLYFNHIGKDILNIEGDETGFTITYTDATTVLV